MRAVIAASAILSVASASGVLPDRGENLARSLQTTVLDHARSVYRDYGRKLETGGEPEPDSFGGDLLGGDFSFCTIFKLAAGQLADDHLSCTCSAPTEASMNLFCKTLDGYDQNLLASECGSITNPTMSMNMSFADPMSTHSTTCMTFGPNYGEDVGQEGKCAEQLKGKEACIGMGVTINMFGSDKNESVVFPDVNASNLDGLEDIIDDLIDVTCDVDIEGHTCNCSMCDDFMGIKSSCTPTNVLGGKALLMNCTEGFSMSEISSEEDVFDAGSTSLDGGFSGNIAFVVPQFVEQNNIVVTDSVDESDEDDEGTGTDGEEDAGAGNVLGAKPAESSGSFMQIPYFFISSAMAFVVISTLA